MSREEYEPFVHALAADARAVTDAELTILFEGSWRERRRGVARRRLAP